MTRNDTGSRPQPVTGFRVPRWQLEAAAGYLTPGENDTQPMLGAVIISAGPDTALTLATVSPAACYRYTIKLEQPCPPARVIVPVRNFAQGTRSIPGPPGDVHVLIADGTELRLRAGDWTYAIPAETGLPAGFFGIPGPPGPAEWTGVSGKDLRAGLSRCASHAARPQKPSGLREPLTAVQVTIGPAGLTLTGSGPERACTATARWDMPHGTAVFLDPKASMLIPGETARRFTASMGADGPSWIAWPPDPSGGQPGWAWLDDGGHCRAGTVVVTGTYPPAAPRYRPEHQCSMVFTEARDLNAALRAVTERHPGAAVDFRAAGDGFARLIPVPRARDRLRAKITPVEIRCTVRGAPVTARISAAWLHDLTRDYDLTTGGRQTVRLGFPPAAGSDPRQPGTVQVYGDRYRGCCTLLTNNTAGFPA